MQTKSETNPIQATECYDSITSSKKTELDTSYCPFNIESGDFAWINEKDQFSIFPNKYISQFEGKKLDAYCREVKGLLRDLLPGRTCTCP